ncbi:unnamed protein product [Arabidopsis arenosa]|uniref:Uncharacterized protein n=1 Tax=Arabidopsis arenosa TaxID=38785 RepID=A0A8S1ZNV6_ARAAE|nr:unnamed protein product [Arabidopsis arenosa]
MDHQVPFVPSVEVLVKALIVISSAAVTGPPSSWIVRAIFCSHHPSVVIRHWLIRKREDVWKRLQKCLKICGFDVTTFLSTNAESVCKSLFGPMGLMSPKTSEQQEAVYSLSTMMSLAPEDTFTVFKTATFLDPLLRSPIVSAAAFENLVKLARCTVQPLCNWALEISTSLRLTSSDEVDASSDFRPSVDKAGKTYEGPFERIITAYPYLALYGVYSKDLRVKMAYLNAVKGIPAVSKCSLPQNARYGHDLGTDYSGIFKALSHIYLNVCLAAAELLADALHESPTSSQLSLSTLFSLYICDATSGEDVFDAGWIGRQGIALALQSAADVLTTKDLPAVMTFFIFCALADPNKDVRGKMINAGNMIIDKHGKENSFIISLIMLASDEEEYDLVQGVVIFTGALSKMLLLRNKVQLLNLGLEDKAWRTKQNSVQLLGAMAFCAPQQLSQCLPRAVPKLTEVLTDTHPNVQSAGQVTSAEPKDMFPYIGLLLPEVRKVNCSSYQNNEFSQVLVDPIPEVRSVAARAVGSLIRGMGENNFPDLVPWLFETLKSDTSNVERSGAAQGLSEVIAALGTDYFENILTDLIRHCSHQKASVRDGYLPLFKVLPMRMNLFVMHPWGLAMSLPLLLPVVEDGIFNDNWRIRQSSVELLGDLLFKEDHLESWLGSLVKGCFLLSFLSKGLKDPDVEKRQSTGLQAMDEITSNVFQKLAQPLEDIARKFKSKELCSGLAHGVVSRYYKSEPVPDNVNNPVDHQAPFVPSVEVLVKALVVISLAAVAGPSSSWIVRSIVSSHRPSIVGTGKRDAVWKSLLGPMGLMSPKTPEQQAAVYSLQRKNGEGRGTGTDAQRGGHNTLKCSQEMPLRRWVLLIMCFVTASYLFERIIHSQWLNQQMIYGHGHDLGTDYSGIFKALSHINLNINWSLHFISLYIRDATSGEDVFDAGWMGRQGIALALQSAADVLTTKDHPAVMTFLISRALADPNTYVRGKMINAGIMIIDKHGKENASDEEEYDLVREGVVIFTGSLAKHLAKDDPKVHNVVENLLEVLNTPSDSVQRAVLTCLSPLVLSKQAKLRAGDIEIIRGRFLCLIDYGVRVQEGYLRILKFLTSSNDSMKIMRKDGYCAAQIELEEHRQHEQLLKRENEFLNLDELNLKLRRADVSVSRAEEDRASSGKNSYSNFDKTKKLSAKRKETEEERMHLLCLYKSILKDINKTHAKHKAASVTGEDIITHINLAVAEEALEQLKKKLGLLESEIRHSSLKVPLKASIP